MPQVTVSVGGRGYQVACDPGQEQRIRDIAAYIDGKVAAFAAQSPQAGEARLLVLAALVVADELSDANEAVRRLKAQSPSAVALQDPANDPAQDPQRTPEDEAAFAEGIERLAARVEAVAARLEASYM
jgi:cell division protein ZapA